LVLALVRKALADLHNDPRMVDLIMAGVQKKMSDRLRSELLEGQIRSGKCSQKSSNPN
jgi:hypothetical protein